MKKLDYFLFALAFVAIGVLYVLHFKGEKKDAPEIEACVVEEKVDASLKIAYVNADSLLMNYKYAIELNDLLMKEQEKKRATLSQKGKSLEKEMSEFQRKIEANAFLSRERAESEQNRLLKAQQDLQELTNKYTAELAQKQQEMNTKLTQKVMAFIQEFNKKKGYNFIFSNTMNDNILFAEKGADITEELLLGLNEAYVAEKEKK